MNSTMLQAAINSARDREATRCVVENETSTVNVRRDALRTFGSELLEFVPRAEQRGLLLAVVLTVDHDTFLLFQIGGTTWMVMTEDYGTSFATSADVAQNFDRLLLAIDAAVSGDLQL